MVSPLQPKLSVREQMIAKAEANANLLELEGEDRERFIITDSIRHTARAAESISQVMIYFLNEAYNKGLWKPVVDGVLMEGEQDDFISWLEKEYKDDESLNFYNHIYRYARTLNYAKNLLPDVPLNEVKFSTFANLPKEFDSLHPSQQAKIAASIQSGEIKRPQIKGAVQKAKQPGLKAPIMEAKVISADQHQLILTGTPEQMQIMRKEALKVYDWVDLTQI